jgi:hypothetical protein
MYVRPRTLDLTRLSSRDWFFIGFALLIAAVATGLRAFHQTSAYELFIDEIQYANIGNSFAAGRGPLLFGEPFFLHPPLFFVIVGTFIKSPVLHDTVAFILALRKMNLIFAAVNTLLAVVITYKSAGSRAALIAGSLYAVDPFLIKFDSRLDLEPSMLTWVLLGVTVALLALRTGETHRTWIFAVAGAAFGLALITKETSLLVTAIPVLLMLAFDRVIQRRESLVVLAAQATVYVIYLVWVWAQGNIGDWWDATSTGARRALGLLQVSGFNSPHAPSFTDRAVANATLFLPSYILIVSATFFTLYLIVRGWRSLATGQPRELPSLATPGAHSTRPEELGLVVCWVSGILVALAYTIAFGTLEEQTFYLIAVPSVIMVSVAADQLVSASRRPVRVVAAALMGALIVGSLGVWSEIHFTRDDTYQAFTAWASTNLPNGTQIGLTDGESQFILPGYGLHAVSSIDDAHTSKSRYVLVSTELSRLGYAAASPQFIETMSSQYRTVFQQSGRTSGDLRLYDLHSPIAAAPAVHHSDVGPATPVPGPLPQSPR